MNRMKRSTSHLGERRSDFLIPILAGILAVGLALLLLATPADAAPPPKKGSNSADLRLTGSVKEAFAGAGQPLSLQFTVGNDGPSSAGNVKLVDSFDAVHLQFEGSSPVTCSAASSSVSCDLGTIEPGLSSSVELSFRPKAEGVTTQNNAKVSSTTTDPNSANNVAALSIPMYASFGCAGYAQTPYVQPRYDGYPPSGSSCQVQFTLESSRTLQLELDPSSYYRGILQAQVSRGLEITEVIAGVFADGQLVAGSRTKTITLGPGRWALTVRTPGTSGGMPGGDIDRLPTCIQLFPVGWICPPLPPLLLPAAEWSASAGIGGFAGRVIDRSVQG